MKKLFITFVILFSISLPYITYANSMKILINHNGVYTDIKQSDFVPNFIPSTDYQTGSFIFYVEALGYYRNELTSLFVNDYNTIIGINPFNNKIVFVMDMNGDTKYDNYTVNEEDFINNLEEGIKNKSIRKSFIENSLNIKSDNNILIDNIHGIKYIFTDNILSEYISLDGLNKHAKYIKSKFPNIYNNILDNGKKYYEGSQLNSFINKQSDYFCSINMNYLKQASSPVFNYNYALLYAVLYHKMTLDDFLFLMPTAEIVSAINEHVFIKYGAFVFPFKNEIMVTM